ncbi:MAG: LytTR family DNA-binding domain-containing protein [Bacteroidia bacterium]|nr:LytTR family DNA-binding domain-containing protein [Bacteroidia bacterium]
MNRSLHILIIEDEIIAARNLQQILKDYPEQVEILATLRSVAKATAWLKDHQEKVDLVLMDIQLTDGISFDIFEKIELRKPIIFTTAFDEYAIRAFKLNSIDYLLKPVLAEELYSALDKWKDINPPSPRIDYRKLAEEIQLYQPKYKHRFLVKRGASLFSIPTSEIAYFHADGNLVLLRTLDNKNYPVSYSLDQLSQELDPEFFFRITRNVLIHFPAIKKVNSYFKGRLSLEVEPPAKENLVISSKKAPAFKEWLDR